jgi:hypothetical protein
LYGRETLSAPVREEHGLKVLRRTCAPKREEVERNWRTLHTEELHK